MAANKAPLPIDRIVEKYGLNPGTMPGILRNRAWANVQRMADEASLTPAQIALLDSLTAFHCVSDQQTGSRASVYMAMAQLVRLLSDTAAGIWTAGVDAEIPGIVAVYGNREAFEDGEYFEWFAHTLGIEDLSVEEKGSVLENYAVLISAGLEAGAQAFTFMHNEVASAMLQHALCNPFGDLLGADEKEESVAIIKLATAWPVEDAEQREKLADFAVVRPEDADAAVALIAAHTPATVEELLGLLDAAPALD